jgi:hypothetical protein
MEWHYNSETRKNASISGLSDLLTFGLVDLRTCGPLGRFKNDFFLFGFADLRTCWPSRPMDLRSPNRQLCYGQGRWKTTLESVSTRKDKHSKTPLTLLSNLSSNTPDKQKFVLTACGDCSSLRKLNPELKSVYSCLNVWKGNGKWNIKIWKGVWTGSGVID